VLGMEPVKGVSLDMKKARESVMEISQRYQLAIDPDAKIEDISVSMQQRVEILKALYRGADTLILDEPTASLTPQEIVELIGIMNNLTADGKSIILITHKLKEIKACADYCTIIRLGKYIGTVKVSDVSESDLASLMVGRNVNFVVNKPEMEPGDVVLEVKNLHGVDYRGVEISNWMGSALYFVFKFSMILIGYLVGTEAITALMNNIPASIQAGLGQSGNLLPALGVAMLMQLTFDRKFGVFFFIGFALAAFLNISTIGAAFFGVCFAVIYYFFGGQKAQLQTVAVSDDEESEEL